MVAAFAGLAGLVGLPYQLMYLFCPVQAGAVHLKPGSRPQFCRTADQAAPPGGTLDRLWAITTTNTNMAIQAESPGLPALNQSQWCPLVAGCRPPPPPSSIGVDISNEGIY